jgi:carboxypeptidase family protein/TonB-dependent receptor-like protein
MPTNSDLARWTLVAVAVAGAVPLGAQATGVVTGRVSDASSALGVAAAVVRVAGSTRVALTDAHGEFRLGDLPAGPSSLFVRAIGYRPIIVDIILEPGESLHLADDVLVLQPAPIVLPGIYAASDSTQHLALTRVGFYERRGRGFGVFAEQSEISRWNSHALSDILRHLNGVQIQANPNYGRTRPRIDLRPYIIELRGCGNVLFFLNGVSLGSSADPQFDLDLLALPQDITAVEVYRGPSEIPLQFNATNSLCGAVLIWSE